MTIEGCGNFPFASRLGPTVRSFYSCSINANPVTLLPCCYVWKLNIWLSGFVFTDAYCIDRLSTVTARMTFVQGLST